MIHSLSLFICILFCAYSTPYVFYYNNLYIKKIYIYIIIYLVLKLTNMYFMLNFEIKSLAYPIIFDLDFYI